MSKLIQNESRIKSKIKSLLLRYYNKLENEQNPNPDTNGEYFFIKNILNKYLNNDLIIFDVGANVGEYTSTIIENTKNINKKAELHLFEPTIDCINELKHKFGHMNNIKINSFGLSDKNGMSQIYYDHKMSGLSSLYKRDIKNKLELTEKIELKRADNYIKDNHINHIDYVKLDVEGHELYALKGFGEYLNNEFIDIIQFEYGGCNIDSGVKLRFLFELLEKAGYIIYKLMPKKLEKKHFSSTLENFNYSNYIALSKKIYNK